MLRAMTGKLSPGAVARRERRKAERALKKKLKKAKGGK